MTLDRDLVSACAKTALKHFRSECRWYDEINEQNLRRDMLADLVGRCWQKALNDSDAFTIRDGTPVAEKAVAACIRSGLDRSRVTCRHDFIRLGYPNFEYEVHKELSGYTAHPIGAAYGHKLFQLVIGFPPETFAAFLAAFDALAPEIRSSVDWLVDQMHDALMDLKRERMVRQVREKAVSTFVEEYLTPIGVSAVFHVTSDYVSIHLSRGETLEGHITVPFEKVREELSDPVKVLSQLREKENPHLWIRNWQVRH